MNANHNRAVIDEALAAARHRGCGCLVISEPNLLAMGSLPHYIDVTNGAAIVDLDGELGAPAIRRSSDYVAADILVVSMYLLPILDIAEFERVIDNICVVVGDP